jgi:hypothetical protein
MATTVYGRLLQSETEKPEAFLLQNGRMDKIHRESKETCWENDASLCEESTSWRSRIRGPLE